MHDTRDQVGHYAQKEGTGGPSCTAGEPRWAIMHNRGARLTIMHNKRDHAQQVKPGGPLCTTGEARLAIKHKR